MALLKQHVVATHHQHNRGEWGGGGLFHSKSLNFLAYLKAAGLGRVEITELFARLQVVKIK